MIKNPQNQKKFTNVAVVRLKRQKKNFEVACYPGKITDWRNKTETDINEVVQTDRIFSDMERGDFASKQDLAKAFKNMSSDEIIIEILNKGEYQVSELERENQLDNLKNEIANIISKMCVNQEDGNQFPVSIIVKAMTELNVKVNANKQPKPQATAIIQQLKQVLPIERARMNLKISFKTPEQAESLKQTLTEKHEGMFQVKEESKEEEGVRVIYAVDPSLFRVINDLVKADKQLYKDVIVEIHDVKVDETAQEKKKN